MPHTNAWENTLPQDSENAGLGASRIREGKLNIYERFRVGHIIGQSQTYDGEHKYDKVINGGSQSSAYAIDLTQGRIFYIKLAGDVTVSISNSDGMSADYGRDFMLAVKQHGTSVYELTFPTGSKFHNNQTINVVTTADWVTVYQFLSFDNGTHWIVLHIGDYQW